MAVQFVFFFIKRKSDKGINNLFNTLKFTTWLSIHPLALDILPLFHLVSGYIFLNSIFSGGYILVIFKSLNLLYTFLFAF